MATAEENSAGDEFEEIDFDFDSDFDPAKTESRVGERRNERSRIVTSSDNYLDSPCFCFGFLSFSFLIIVSDFVLRIYDFSSGIGSKSLLSRVSTTISAFASCCGS